MCRGPTYDVCDDDERGANTMKILELRAPNEDGWCYAEGEAEPLLSTEPADPRNLLPYEDKGWFCFEETWVDTCMILSRELRFTATQIMEAVEA